MNTLLLDRTTWDLCKDASGNIAMAKSPYAVAQDVASACRLFKGELWYDTTQGIPYFEQILGKAPPLGIIKSLLSVAADTVPEVQSSKVFLSGVKNRVLTGQVQVITTASPTPLAVTVALPPNTLTDSVGNPLTDEFGNPL